MAEYDEPAPEANATLDGAATATADGRSPPSKRGDGRSPQPHEERSSKSRGRDREPDEDRDTERHRRRRTDGERYLDRESGRDRGDRSRDLDRDRHHHHREHRERSERREHRDRSDDRGYRPSRDRDAERGDCDRDGHRRHRSHSRSESQSKRVSGFDQGPSEAIHMAALPAVPAPIPGMLPNMPNMLPNMYNLPNLGQPQQATRHARRVYVDGLSPSANEEAVAIFFNQVMAAIGGNTVGVGDAVVNVYINHDKKFAFVEMRSVEEASNAMALDGITFDGAPVKVRRPTDYNPSQAALLGPSQPNPNLNLAAVGLTPGLGGGLEGPDRIFVGGLPYYLTEDQVRELLETFGPQLDVLEPIETVAICYGVLRLLDKAGNTVEAVDTFLQHNLYPPLVNCLIQGDTEVTTLVFYAIKLLAEIPKGIDVIFPPDCQGSIQLEKVAAQSSSGLAEHRHRNIFFLLKTSLLAHISDVINDPSIDSHVRSRASSVSRRLNSSSDVFMTTEKCCMEAEYACCMSINKAWASSHLHESNLSEIVGKVEEFTKTNLEFILWRIVFDPDYTPPNNIHKVNQHKLRDFEDIMSYATPDVAYFLYHQPVRNITRSIGNKSGERWRQISPPSLGTICTITKFKFYKDGKKQNGRMEEFLLQVRNKEDTENLVLCRVYVTEQSADTILRPGPQPLPLLSRLHEEVGVETLQKAEEHLQEMTVQWTAKISQLEEELKAAREVASKAMERCDKQNEIIQHLNCRLIEVNHQIVEGDNLRKKQHDRILVLKGNLRVFVRVKPLQKKNNSNGMQIEPIIACTKLKESPDYTVGVNGKVFAFDKVFDHKASQEDVFVEMAELVESVLDGENVSIFTYGQTGSGKTYTMIGELGDQAGIIPRALKQILIAKESKEKAGLRISLKVSVLEFYNDESKDLLGESVNIVNSDSDVAYYVQLVKTNRSVATTNMNKASSRSHLVFSLHVSQSNEDTKVESTINLIDLAGSERLPKSGSEGEQKKEAMAINKSLAALSRVLTAIARKESYIPWRDSNLMYYLKPCLEENSKKVMLVNVSSEEEQMSETTSSLVFGSLVNRTDVVPAPGGKHKCGKNMFSPPCGKSKSALHKRKAPFLSPAQSRKTCVRN